MPHRMPKKKATHLSSGKEILVPFLPKVWTPSTTGTVLVTPEGKRDDAYMHTAVFSLQNTGEFKINSQYYPA